MSHAYAARGSRQTAVLTAIVGLHFAVFLVVSLGLVPRVTNPAPMPIAITRLPPRPEPEPVVIGPEITGDIGMVSFTVDEPNVDIPLINDPQVVPTNPDRDADRTGESRPEPAGEYLAPRLHTRTSHIAALIDSCYPTASRRLNEEGEVTARITIGAGGSVLDWSVATSSGYARLDSATACVIRKLEFIAGRRDGQAVAADALLPIVFRLD
jgi:periplasmic protein TonB